MNICNGSEIIGPILFIIGLRDESNDDPFD